MKRRLAALAAFASLALGAAAKPVLVPDVSARNIEIRYTFAGAQLLLFGAILYPSGRIPDEAPDIAKSSGSPGSG
jgi:acyl-coenzyme A synthetase/AMP-(fatty) acid ligase